MRIQHNGLRLLQRGGIEMKHLINGAAVAAILALATPVWAQTTSAPPTPVHRQQERGREAAPATQGHVAAPPKHSAVSHRQHERGREPAPAGQSHAAAMHTRTAVRHRHYERGRSISDNSADQLNRDELSHLPSGANTMAPPPR